MGVVAGHPQTDETGLPHWRAPHKRRDQGRAGPHSPRALRQRRAHTGSPAAASLPRLASLPPFFPPLRSPGAWASLASPPASASDAPGLPSLPATSCQPRPAASPFPPAALLLTAAAAPPRSLFPRRRRRAPPSVLLLRLCRAWAGRRPSALKLSAPLRGAARRASLARQRSKAPPPARPRRHPGFCQTPGKGRGETHASPSARRQALLRPARYTSPFRRRLNPLRMNPFSSVFSYL